MHDRNRQGVVVTAVDPGGPAAEHGFQTGDLILDVAGKAVSKPADVRDRLAELRKEGKHTGPTAQAHATAAALIVL
jgi:serine protease Do